MIINLMMSLSEMNNDFKGITFYSLRAFTFAKSYAYAPTGADVYI